jgi:hypothetical protein
VDDRHAAGRDLAVQEIASDRARALERRCPGHNPESIGYSPALDGSGRANRAGNADRAVWPGRRHRAAALHLRPALVARLDDQVRLADAAGARLVCCALIEASAAMVRVVLRVEARLHVAERARALDPAGRTGAVVLAFAVDAAPDRGRGPVATRLAPCAVDAMRAVPLNIGALRVAVARDGVAPRARPGLARGRARAAGRSSADAELGGVDGDAAAAAVERVALEARASTSALHRVGPAAAAAIRADRKRAELGFATNAAAAAVFRIARWIQTAAGTTDFGRRTAGSSRSARRAAARRARATRAAGFAAASSAWPGTTLSACILSPIIGVAVERLHQRAGEHAARRDQRHSSSKHARSLSSLGGASLLRLVENRSAQRPMLRSSTALRGHQPQRRSILEATSLHSQARREPTSSPRRVPP